MGDGKKTLLSLIFTFILLARSETSQLTLDPGNDQCIYTDETPSNEFYFNIILDIENLRFTSSSNEQNEKNQLERALRDYYNEAIDCACPKNSVLYTAVIITDIDDDPDRYSEEETGEDDTVPSASPTQTPSESPTNAPSSNPTNDSENECVCKQQNRRSKLRRNRRNPRGRNKKKYEKKQEIAKKEEMQRNGERRHLNKIRERNQNSKKTRELHAKKNKKVHKKGNKDKDGKAEPAPCTCGQTNKKGQSVKNGQAVDKGIGKKNKKGTKKQGHSLRRNLISIETAEDSLRILSYHNTSTGVEHSATGVCGAECPTNPLPGSSCIDCGNGGFFRHLLGPNSDDTVCGDTLFIDVFSRNGIETTGIANVKFENVTREETPFISAPTSDVRASCLSGDIAVCKELCYGHLCCITGDCQCHFNFTCELYQPCEVLVSLDPEEAFQEECDVGFPTSAPTSSPTVSPTISPTTNSPTRSPTTPSPTFDEVTRKCSSITDNSPLEDIGECEDICAGHICCVGFPEVGCECHLETTCRLYQPCEVLLFLNNKFSSVQEQCDAGFPTSAPTTVSPTISQTTFTAFP